MIEQVLAGNSRAFGMLVERYERAVYLAAFSFLGDRQDAEDVTQDVFVSAFKRLGSFEGRSSFLTWLRRIAFNRCVDQRRRTGAQKAVLHDFDESPVCDSAQSGPTDTVENRELVHSIRSAIADLAEDQKAVVVMRDIEGLDYSEIAEVLEIPIGTVRSRLHRARLELKSILESRGVHRAMGGSDIQSDDAPLSGRRLS